MAGIILGFRVDGYLPVGVHVLLGSGRCLAVWRRKPSSPSAGSAGAEVVRTGASGRRPAIVAGRQLRHGEGRAEDVDAVMTSASGLFQAS